MQLIHIILTFSYIGVFITVFAESGFFLGFFLPGDSLLFTLGIIASQGKLNIWYLLILCIAGAILGDNFGYWMGRKFGKPLFYREESFFFKRERVQRTHEFFERYGKKTIILSRFVPIVRTFSPILAGIGEMNYKIFLSYNVIGGVFWTGGFLGISYYLGSKIPNIENYLGYIILAIIVASALPVAIDYLRKR